MEGEQKLPWPSCQASTPAPVHIVPRPPPPFASAHKEVPMKIYTKTGDAGQTGLFNAPRVRKDHPRIEAYGQVDELNAQLGLIRCEPLDPPLDRLLARVQNELFDLGAELATPDPAEPRVPHAGPAQISALEGEIDRYEASLPPLKTFILPGGARAAALLHVARTVCRRAERAVIHLAHQPGESVNAPVIVYLNRLSDLLFVLARAVNQAQGAGDVAWEKRAE